MIVTLQEALDYMRAEQVVDQNIVQAALLAAHETFYDLCQRNFEVAGAASARLYVPPQSDILRIHDCTTITAITVDGSALAAADWQAEPVGLDWTGRQRPYDRIRHHVWTWGTYWGWSQSHEATVSVTATWGWAATPATAKEAVKMLCKDIATARDVLAGFLSFGEAGVAAARKNRDVMDAVVRLGRDDQSGIAG
jgi:hypothetical protein